MTTHKNNKKIKSTIEVENKVKCLGENRNCYKTTKKEFIVKID